MNMMRILMEVEITTDLPTLQQLTADSSKSGLGKDGNNHEDSGEDDN